MVFCLWGGGDSIRDKSPESAFCIQAFHHTLQIHQSALKYSTNFRMSHPTQTVRPQMVWPTLMRVWKKQLNKSEDDIGILSNVWEKHPGCEQENVSTITWDAPIKTVVSKQSIRSICAILTKRMRESPLGNTNLTYRKTFLASLEMRHHKPVTNTKSNPLNQCNQKWGWHNLSELTTGENCFSLSIGEHKPLKITTWVWEFIVNNQSKSPKGKDFSPPGGWATSFVVLPP